MANDWPREVRLTPAEFGFCASIATARSATKANQGGWGHANAFDAHLTGVVAEVAARKVYGGKIDQAVRPNGDNHAPDLITSAGALEVKAVTWAGSDPMLKISADEKRPEVRYVLVQSVTATLARVFPPIDLDGFRAVGSELDFGYGKRLSVTGEQIIKHHRTGAATL